MEKQILLPPEVKKEMIKTFGVNEMALSRAFRFVLKTPKARMLRAAAIQRGGFIYVHRPVPQGWVPNVETINDGDVMIQVLNERVQLKIDKTKNSLSLIVDGAEILIEENVTIQRWGEILYTLQQASEMFE